MWGDERFLRLQVAGTETGYEGVHVTCLIATLPCAGASGAPELETKLRAELDPTCLLPVDEQHPVPRMVVASLDINQGPRLPAEELAGTRPEQRDPGPRRAYLSNICTAAPMRRLGVAAALIEHACAVARQQGVTDCYVHVADDNPGAERLYTQVRHSHRWPAIIVCGRGKGACPIASNMVWCNKGAVRCQVGRVG